MSADTTSLLSRLCSYQPLPLSELPTHEEIETGELCREAQREGVAGWIYRRLCESYPSEKRVSVLASQLRLASMYVAVDNARNSQILCRIEQLLAKARIAVVALKGIALSNGYYGDVSLRPIGDLDLYVDPAHIYEARNILIADGAVSTGTDRPPIIDSRHAHLPSLRYCGQSIELHHRLYAPSEKLDVDGLFQLTERRNSHLMLMEQPMFYHLVTHAYRHFLRMERMRVGWLVDLAVLIEQSSDAEGLLRYVRSANAFGTEALQWCLARVMPMLSTDKQHILEHCGFQAVQLTQRDFGRGRTVTAFKLKALRSKIREMLMRLSVQKGWKEKIEEIRKIVSYENHRTLAAYPKSNALWAWLQRIFGGGITARNFRSNDRNTKNRHTKH